MRDFKRVAILISGRGSNMRALVERASGYEVALVASNKLDAAGLQWAQARLSGLNKYLVSKKARPQPGQANLAIRNPAQPIAPSQASATRG